MGEGIPLLYIDENQEETKLDANNLEGGGGEGGGEKVIGEVEEKEKEKDQEKDQNGLNEKEETNVGRTFCYISSV